MLNRKIIESKTNEKIENYHVKLYPEIESISAEALIVVGLLQRAIFKRKRIFKEGIH
jgi:hypothetical protein